MKGGGLLYLLREMLMKINWKLLNGVNGFLLILGVSHISTGYKGLLMLPYVVLVEGYL